MILKMIKVTKCPLCKSKKNIFYSSIRKNLYSEKISKIIQINDNLGYSKGYNYAFKKLNKSKDGETIFIVSFRNSYF